MGPDGTELNLDGISKPELEKIGSRASDITGTSRTYIISESSIEVKCDFRTFDEYLQAQQLGQPTRTTCSVQIDSERQ